MQTSCTADGHRRVLQRIPVVLEAVDRIDVSVPVREAAARRQLRAIRPLDAIHLATALSVDDDPDLEVITSGMVLCTTRTDRTWRGRSRGP